MAQVTFVQLIPARDDADGINFPRFYQDQFRKTYDTAWLRQHLFELDGWAYELHGDDNSLYKFMMSDIPYQDVLKQIEEAEVKEISDRFYHWGIKLESGYNYELDARENNSQDGVALRRYDSTGVMAEILIPKDDWPYVQKWLHQIYWNTLPDREDSEMHGRALTAAGSWALDLLKAMGLEGTRATKIEISIPAAGVATVVVHKIARGEALAETITRFVGTSHE